MPDLSLEQQLYRQGYRLVAGVDEAGRGPLAGPVVAAAVVLPNDLSGLEPWLATINDSKKLSARQREKAAELIQDHAWSVGVGQLSPQEIDRVGIGNACIQAMLAAVADRRCPRTKLCRSLVPPGIFSSSKRHFALGWSRSLTFQANTRGSSHSTT